MLQPILTILLYLGTVALMVGGMLAISMWLGPSCSRSAHKKTPIVAGSDSQLQAEQAIKNEPFECGIPHPPPISGRISVKYYLVGLLFLLFDVEMAFLIPWAAVFREIGLAGFLAMMIFLSILSAGLVYIWRLGALQWD